MKKCLLTSAGFENLAVKEAFLELVGKEPSQIKALWCRRRPVRRRVPFWRNAWRICLTQESGLKYYGILEEPMPLASCAVMMQSISAAEARNT